MFDDIGLKIKNFAKVAYYIFAVIYGLGGFITAIVWAADEGEFLIFLGVIAATAAIILVNWIFFAVLYGFGELVENSSRIAENQFQMSQPDQNHVNSYDHSNTLEFTSAEASKNLSESGMQEENKVKDGQPGKKNYTVNLSKEQLANGICIGVEISNPVTSTSKYFLAKAFIHESSVDFISDEKELSFTLKSGEINDTLISSTSVTALTKHGNIKFTGIEKNRIAVYQAIKKL